MLFGAKRALPAAVLVVLTTQSACAPDDPPPPPPCGGEAERCVIPGHTSAGLCVEGTCLGLTARCETDVDCSFAIDAGDTVPAWDRPQGGLGTRLNARLEGFAEDNRFLGLQTRIFGAYQLEDPQDPDSLTACEPELCEDEASCPCDAEAGFSCVTEPGGAQICAELVCNQTNRRFPTAVDDSGALVVAELPIRFVNGLGLEALDGRDVTLIMSLLIDEADAEHAIVPVTLDVGPFVEPSWWEQ